MKNKKKDINIIIVLSLYVAICVMFLVFSFSVPKISQGVETRYLNNIQKILKETFDTVPPKELSQTLDQIRNDQKIEIAVYFQNKQVYQSIPDVPYKHLRGLLANDVVLYEVQGDLQTPYGTYQIWYIVHRPSANLYLKNLLVWQNAFIGVAFILLLIVIVMVRKQLKQPLIRIKQMTTQLSKYQFEDMEFQADDEITKSLGQFAINLQDRIQSVNRNHTELEYALQLERERLANLIVVSRGIIHDLKSPVHQTLLENDFYIKNHPQAEGGSIEVAEYNIERMDTIMQQINEVLHLMDTDVQEMTDVAHHFNIVDVFREIRQSFQPLLREKKVLLESNIPDELNVSINKVTTRLIIHNILSNAIQYAEEHTEIDFEIEEDATGLMLRCTNQTLMPNIERIQRSEDLFQSIPISTDNDETYIYSTGNGLYLIKELTKLLQGNYELQINQNMVTVVVCIPQKWEE